MLIYKILDCILHPVIKVYDHSHLALHQIENTTNILEKSINSAKIDLQETVKGMEREYISILGIFASIIIAFVGGMTFSTIVYDIYTGRNTLYTFDH